MNYFFQLLIGLVSGSFGAWVATKFALSRFYNERWWEKRAQAFIEITDSIYQVKILQEYYSDLEEFQRHGPEEFPNFFKLNDEQIEEMEVSSKKSKDLIIKYSHAGQLLLTESATNLLRNYLKEEMKVDNEVNFKGWDIYEANEHLLKMTQELYANMLLVARKELKAQ